jgi:hypothetical protein
VKGGDQERVAVGTFTPFVGCNGNMVVNVINFAGQASIAPISNAGEHGGGWQNLSRGAC